MEHMPGGDQHRVQPTDSARHAVVRQTAANLRARAANLRRESSLLRANAEVQRRKIMDRVQQIHDDLSTWPSDSALDDPSDDPDPDVRVIKTPAQPAEERRSDRLANQRAQLADQRYRLHKLHERLKVRRASAASRDEEAS